MQAAIGYKNFLSYVTPFVNDESASNMYANDLGMSVKPHFYNLNINRMCRAKAEDMDSCLDQFEIELCNGTTYDEYRKWWVTDQGKNAISVTNAASGTGNNKAFHAVAFAVCNGMFRNTLGGTADPDFIQCAEDSADLMRYTFFNESRQTGCGFYGYGSEEHAEYNDSSYAWGVWVSETLVYTSNRIASGAHVPNPMNVDQFVFKVNYASTETLTKAQLVYGEQVIDLKTEFSGAGGIAYTSESMSDVPGECVPYYFQFEYDGTTETYPEKGKFMTFGLGSCTLDYVGDDCTEGACCNTQMKMFLRSTTKCKESTACTKEAYCTGSSSTCPEPDFKPSTTICRKADKPCEEDSYCTGDSGVCPGIQYKAAGTVCIEEKLPCQDNSYCDGKTGECKAVFKSNNTFCESSNTDCVKDHFCTGTSNTCNKTVAFQPGGELCSYGKCSGFDASCSRKIGTVTVKFGMDNDVSTEGLADGIIEGILGGNTDGLLRIKKTEGTKGISVIVELTNSNRAKVLYDGLKKAGKLGDYGTVKDLSIQELFETLELNGSERE